MGNRVFSFGGGVQSMAVLALAASGNPAYQYDAFIFSNVGALAENPKTFKYMEEHAIPFAAKHGLNLIETAWIGQRGPQRNKERDLYTDLLNSSRSIDIPVRLKGGGFGNRKCTSSYKIQPVAKWNEEHGATKELPAIVGLGISWDESERVADSKIEFQINEYPLVNNRITRKRCEQIILNAGLPIPPKSACWFCPFQNLRQWQEMRKSDPELFEKACCLEELLNARRIELGLDMIFFAAGELPLRELNDNIQLSLFEGCDSGYCWT